MPGGGKRVGPGPGSTATQQGKANWSRRNNAPVLFLSINDQSADDLLRKTISFTHKRSLGKAAETKFVISNGDRKLLDDARLFPNTEWRYRFGYFSDLSPIKQGFIRQIEPTYGMNRHVTVTLYDAMMQASVRSHGKNWGKVQSSEIAKKIAASHGMQAIVVDSKDVPSKSWIQPNDVNDMRYLRDLAALIDYEVFVDGVPAVLYFRPKPYDVVPKAILTYYDDPTETSYVKAFSPKVKSLGPLLAGVSGTDHEKGKGDKKTNDDPTKKKPGLNVYLNFQNTGRATITTGPKKDVSTPVPSGLNTTQLVEAARQQMLDKANQATSEHPLTPSITAGDIFEWRGIEKQLSGKWYAFEEHHEISGTSSSTRVTWKRNTTGKGSDKASNTNNKDAGKQQGKVGIVYALQGAGSVVRLPPGSPATSPITAPAPVSRAPLSSVSGR